MDLLPDPAKEPDGWKLTIDGEVNKPLEITLGELKKRTPTRTYRMVLECGGNGRSFFTPQARGNQWTNGGAGCAEWTGIPLASVLRTAGVKSSAVYTANYGTDVHLSGDPKRETLSRGVPVAKAMSEHSLLVWAMNGQPLENIHGGPLRLVHPGWPGSDLAQVAVQDHAARQGARRPGHAGHLLPRGDQADDARRQGRRQQFQDPGIDAGAQRHHQPHERHPAAAGTREMRLRGAAWAGDLEVRRVDVSTDFGATWRQAALSAPKNRFDWRRWTATIRLPSDGYYEVWARATNSAGTTQPHVAGNWNPQGYGGNPMHRIAVLVG